MLEGSTRILRIACAALVFVVLLQAAQIAARKDPLAGVIIPNPAALPRSSNSPPSRSAAPNAPPGQPGGPPPSLPPAIQARVDRITASEILGPAPRPMPLALIGIAGRDAFLRGTNGQTGLVREGEQFGLIKVLQIGTNRVLIEEGGLRRELDMFSGFGSESLLPHPKESPQ